MRDAGFTGTISREFASFDTADVSKPAEAILGTDPTSGTEAVADTPITIRTNPVDEDMPRVVPGFDGPPGEPETVFTAKLTELGLTAKTQTLPSGFEPGTVAMTSPAPGTRVRQGNSGRSHVGARWRNGGEGRRALPPVDASRN